MKHVINQLVEQLDTDTACGPFLYEVLEYAGDLDKSPFLRAVVSKAKKLNIPCQEYKWKTSHHFSVLIDRELVAPWCLSLGEDIDNLQHDGMSCVAEAVFMLLKKLDFIEGKHITIVGRGHSVKGLADSLLAHNATVTVAHSKTDSLIHATHGQNVVIYATPGLDRAIAYDTTDLVIDLGNCVPHQEWLTCPYVNNVGRLTVSVLLNRHAMGGI